MSSLKTLDELNSRYKWTRIAIALIVFVSYVLLGVVYFNGVMELTVLESVYFSVVIFSTVGYGHYIPRTQQDRDFITFYILVGIVTVGTIIGSVGDFIMEAAGNITNKIALELSIRMELTRGIFDRAHTRPVSAISSADPQGQLTRASAGADGTESLGLNLEHLRETKQHSFDAELEELSRKAKLDLITVLVLLALGTFSMSAIQNWSIAEAGYWAVVTLCTVGYGEIYPNTDSGRIFFIFYALVGCVFMAKALNNLAKYPVVRRAKREEMRMMQKFGEQLSESTLVSLLHNDLLDNIPGLRAKAGEVSKSEFVLLLLHLMNKVNDKDITLISRTFDFIDVDEDGVLNQQEVHQEVEKARDRALAESEQERQAAEEQQQNRNRAWSRGSTGAGAAAGGRV